MTDDGSVRLVCDTSRWSWRRNEYSVPEDDYAPAGEFWPEQAENAEKTRPTGTDYSQYKEYRCHRCAEPCINPVDDPRTEHRRCADCLKRADKDGVPL